MASGLKENQTQNRHPDLLGGRYVLRGSPQRLQDVLLYPAEDLQLNREVVIQCPAHERGNDAEFDARFLAVQQKASAVTNCPILSVYDLGEWQGRPFSVMESSKGERISAVWSGGKRPLVEDVLRQVRQVAEALHCCREAGLSAWRYHPDAAYFDRHGEGRLAIVGGIDAAGAAAEGEEDAAVLLNLLALGLLGNMKPSAHEIDGSGLPRPLKALLSRLPSGQVAGLGAGAVASELGKIEEIAYRPTAAILPGGEPAPVALAGAALGAGAAKQAYSGPAQDTAAATLPAPVNSAQPAPYVGSADEPPGEPVFQNTAGIPAPRHAATARRPRRGLAAFVLPLLLLALVIGVAAFAVSRSRDTTRVQAVQSPAQPAAPQQATPASVAAPALVGRSLSEAQAAASAAGFALSQGPAVITGEVAAGTVVTQDPPAGTLLQPGGTISVTLSAGPEATAPPAVQNNAPAPVQRGNKGKGKGRDKDEGGGDD